MCMEYVIFSNACLMLWKELNPTKLWHRTPGSPVWMSCEEDHCNLMSVYVHWCFLFGFIDGPGLTLITILEYFFIFH